MMAQWMRLSLLAALALALTRAEPAWAQQRPQRSQPARPAPAPAPVPEPPPPPYEPQILRLASIMGALSLLEDVCQLSDGQAWRQRMQALMDAEEAQGSRRERLAGAFNQSFLDYQDSHRTCTPAAREAMERFRREGAALTAGMTSRFGG